ncbi:retinol-binding protein pinta-like [Phlebotomus papatasi]|uniref:Uncharacterized protein n=1 Tax=Phlebotomus papatasi TaxID=29031 RepID=A0A1B0EVG2_PHLPP|nr:retinol-binding protein pinta-like [Phlebotomus papatasi]XP_055703506.1 retinol-binding protein pinta-like [Phlebotomus papatasi]
MAQVRPLSSELSLQAQDELGEISGKIESDLQALKDWIGKQSHLTARTDDQFLIAFLRGCKYSLERAKEKIDMYYTIRTAIPEFFVDRDPQNKKLLEVLRLGLSLPLPIPVPENGSRILLVKQGAYDPSKISVVDVLKVSYMITDVMIWDDDNCAVAGQTILVDLQGLSFGHLTQVTPTLLKKMTSSIQEAYPIRQKGMHFINPMPGFESLFKIFHGFLSEKIKKRTFVHGSLEDLHKHIPKALLPTEYGGDAGPVQQIIDDWTDKLLERRDWFLEDDKFKSDERKRVGKAKNADILMQGSFRTLEFD